MSAAFEANESEKDMTQQTQNSNWKRYGSAKIYRGLINNRAIQHLSPVEFKTAFIAALDGMPSPLSPWVRPESSNRPSASEWNAIRSRIFRRDDFTCRYCGERGCRLECDHVKPVSAGGTHDDENLVTSCRPCNRAKRNTIVSIEEWSAKRRAAL